jgi:hypothetical protein
MRTLLTLCFALAAGCGEKEFVCSGPAECIDRYGERGLCLESRCAFRELDCASGYQWDDAAGPERAGQCVPGDRLPSPDAGVTDARPGDAM